MKTTLNKNLKAGFSLVEMLVVIAVIGIIAAIAVPTIGSITSKANENKAKRNAQNIASVYTSALAAGAVVTGTTDGVIAGQLINPGVTGTGSFAGVRFRVPNLAGADLTEALGYLKTESGLLTYTQTIDTSTD